MLLHKNVICVLIKRIQIVLSSIYQPINIEDQRLFLAVGTM